MNYRTRKFAASALIAASVLGAAALAIVGPADAAGAKPKVAAAVAADAKLLKFNQDWMTAALSRDGKFIAANSIDSPDGSFLVFGTSGEQGHDFKGFIAHLDELKPFKWTGIDGKGYSVGDVAWVYGTASAPMPTGDVAKARFTLVARLVGGEWKTVHFHLSEPVARKGIKKDQ